MAKQKIETSIEINGIDVVAYPLVESDHVTFENGMSINEMIKGDVVTPVVTHEETSFKVGKGDSDVSSSIVDSSVGEMAIKGQTYQNILPEPSLRNSMSNGKTIQKFNEGYDNVNVVDGVGKSAILKGYTLVNCIIDTSAKGYGNLAFSIDKNGWITAKAGSSNKHFELKMNNLNIKTSTKYLFVFECESNSFEGSGATLMIGNTYPSVVDSPWNEQKAIKLLPVGITKFVLSTKNDFSSLNNPIGCRSYISVGSGETKFRYMILEYQEGMEDWDIPYFEGMKSVESPSLVSVGKNLCDRVRGYHSNTGGTQNSWASFDMSCKPNTTYTAKIFGGSNNRFGFYSGVGVIGDASPYTVTTGNFTQYAGGEKAFTITTGKNDNVMWVYLDNNSIASLDDVVVQVEQGIQATPYEPYKSNTVTTPSDLTLRGIGDVYDTLDLVSGEKVERLISFVLDNTKRYYNFIENEKTVQVSVATAHLKTKKAGKVLSTIFPRMNYSPDEEHIRLDNSLPYSNLVIGINKNRLDEVSLKGVEQFFQQNNYEVLLELDEPIITQIPLSSSGNWEKVVLDGSEDEKWLIGTASNGVGKYFVLNEVCTPNLPHTTNTNAFCDKFPYVRFLALDDKGFGFNSSYGLRFHIEEVNIYKGATVEDFRQYLSQNPITVWYQTTTHKDSTQVKQLLSFSNGHVQLSSKEGSLIPSLDYEVPTSNSYHLDLAKTSTQYTMKNMSGTFTIDGNSYNASTNSAFTTPTSMANKLMITSVTQSNAMLLEGNLTSKTIPYFKGIKSAFEGEDKIEVLSVGKNLFDGKERIWFITDNGEIPQSTPWRDWITDSYIPIKENTPYHLNVSVNKSFYFYDKDKKFISAKHNIYDYATSPKNARYLLVKIASIKELGQNVAIYEGKYKQDTYEPYKSNITKIPLSSPLRSLPNGVRDEVILDRGNNKVKVIQRIGMFKFDSKDKYGCSIYVENGWDTNNSTGFIYRKYTPKGIDGVENKNDYHMCDNLDVSTRNTINSKTNVCVLGDGQYIGLKISNDKVGHNGNRANDYLSKNPTTVYYQLATPIITEIDLDGYPYVYKDGHIFLNSEIAPTTTMKYSINQSHQIASQNGDLIRHEKEINYLYTLIAKYVNVQYESTLLNLDLELSRA